jgi:uncharacterized protein (TIGR02284 family)
MEQAEELQHRSSATGGLAAAATPYPEDEDSYWQAAYQQEPYYLVGYPYEDYRPAYELGWHLRQQWGDDFDNAVLSLASDWEEQRANSKLTWLQAIPAIRAAWDRAQRAPSAETMAAVDAGEVVAALNDLIETCHDGESGFSACAEHTSGESLRNLFWQRASECRAAAFDLQEQVIRLGGEPAVNGSTGAALHRGWVTVRGTLMGYTDLAMLDECARSEDIVLAHYHQAAAKPLTLPARAVVQRQLDSAQRSHDQIVGIRDMQRSQHGA